MFLIRCRFPGTEAPTSSAAHFRYVQQGEGTHKRFGQDALNRLYDHSWPGNVRELKNCVHRAFIMADEVIGALRAEELPGTVVEEDAALLTVRVGTPLDDIERRVTMATLAQCGNVKRRAAEILGISVKTLYNRLEAYAASDSATRAPGHLGASGCPDA